MIDDFLIRAALAGFGVALAAGPLGCFVVWRRMAYLGEAISHSALLGVALGLAFQAPPLLGALLVALMLGVTVALSPSRGQLAPDTLLGVLAHSALALGLVVISLSPALRVDISGYLFGDVLAVSWTDVALVWCGSAGVALTLIWRWRPLLNSTISEALARAEGQQPDVARLSLALAMAFSIALAMQVVGLLLVTSMLILPAAAARGVAQTPEGMARIAAALGCMAVALGLGASFTADTPAGPSIVVVLGAMAALSGALRAARRRRRS